MGAAIGGHIDVVKVLLGQNASANLQDEVHSYLFVPLILSCESRSDSSRSALTLPSVRIISNGVHSCPPSAPLLDGSITTLRFMMQHHATML